MDPFWKNVLWSQFGAAIDMLENLIRACPDTLWDDRSQHIVFWEIAYHTLFWLDFYLSGIRDDFTPPPPFTMPRDLPERPYTREQLLEYLKHGRDKCRMTIQDLTDEQVRELWGFDDWDEKLTFGELLLYTMRHVHEHTGQLGLLLGQSGDTRLEWRDWVGKAKA
jgi:uncharacterized damage-inducible protein DinB